MGNGILFILSGPSGVGKGTVLAELFKTFTGVNYSVSATTRKPREGEIDGRDYFFVSEEEFTKMRANNEFIESARVHGHYYGTPQKYVDDCLQNDKDIILEIDIQGAEQVRGKYPDAIYIFLVPPSFHELENRLDKRGSEDQKSKKLRLKNARDEMKQIVKYDYIVVNDNLQHAVSKIENIIIKEQKLKRC